MSVQMVDRLVLILEALAEGELGVNELARRTGLSKGATHRLLTALHDHRLVQREPDSRLYRLGYRLMELGASVINQIDYGRIASPHLRALVDITSETVHLAIMEEGRVFYVAKEEGSRSLRMPSHIGASNPIHCTAVGKVLLAYKPEPRRSKLLDETPRPSFTPKTIVDPDVLKEHLAKILSQGFAVDDEEREIGLRCIAAPVRDHTNQVVAAISLSGPVGRVTINGTNPDFVALVKKTAAAISRDFGFHERQADSDPLRRPDSALASSR